MMALIGEDHRKWWVLTAMGSILGVILLDETVVGVALPSIQFDLAMSEVASHWVVNIYMLVLAGLAAAAGKFGDIVGHKTLVNTGLLIFDVVPGYAGFHKSANQVSDMRVTPVPGVGVGDDERAEVDFGRASALFFTHARACEVLVTVGAQQRSDQRSRLVGDLTQWVAC